MAKVTFLFFLLLVSVCHCKPQGHPYNNPGNNYRPYPAYGTPGIRTGGFQFQVNPGLYNAGPGDDYYEPADYQFQYDVSAYEYGTRFGHQESRMGEFTRGRYYVDLPDGRTQVVEYTADETGYHPRIYYS